MNYEDMRDFEIEQKVSIIVNGDDLVRKAPYCSKAEWAWPVIVDNRINITHRSDGDTCAEVFCESENNWISAVCKNPLRAAMICFLKVKGAE